MLATDGWTWRVHYSDNTMFDEVDPDGTTHGFKEVDLPRVAIVEWIPVGEGLAGHIVKIDSLSGMRPILFRRRTRIINPNVEGDEGTEGPVIHCIGWQKTVQGVNVASYCFLFDDGSSLTTDDYQAV